MTLKPCLDCGALSEQSRCPEHRTEQERARGSAAARGYDAEWRRLVRAAVRAHLLRYGSVCPGWGVPPHTATKAELTGDHKIPLSLGGKNEASNIEVMCRRCNSRKGGRSMVPREARNGPVSVGHQNPENPATAEPLPEKPKRQFHIYQYPETRH